MSRETHVRFWESARVRSPRATHLPFYRQHQRMNDGGITVTRPWLTQTGQKAIRLLEPIYDAQLASVVSSRVKAMDDKFVGNEFGPR